MPISKPKSALVRAFCIAALAGFVSQARAGGPVFLVGVSNTTPRLSEMRVVTTAPFGTSVITTTNAGVVSTNGAPWSAMALGQGGTLYGITLEGGLAAIDPTTAASSVYGDLHLTGSAPGAEVLLSGAGMAVTTNGEAYVSDGLNLFTANLGSGLCSNIGVFSQAGAGGSPFVFSLAEAPNGTLFGLFLGLYTVNPTNAQVTPVGAAYPFGGGNSPVHAQGAAFGPDGNLYMVGWDNTRTNPPKLYKVNTNNGMAAVLGVLPFGSSGLVALPQANPNAPAIDFPPASQTVMDGGTATFSVTGRGTPPPAVQWYFGNSEYPGATNSTLTITNVSLTNAGSYFVVLTNTGGTATSEVVTLSVTAPIVASTGAFVFTFGQSDKPSQALTISALLNSATNSILGLTTNPPAETVLLNSNTFFSCLSFGPQGKLFGAGENFVVFGPGSGPGPQPLVVGIQGVEALYTINTQAGTTNFIGNFQTIGGSPVAAPIGMAFSPSGVLFVASGGSLYTVSTKTAVMTLVGAFPIGAAIGGIAFSPDGTLYGGQTNLYTINPTNATLTAVGPLNGASASTLADMKFGADGFLYFFDGAADGNLFRMNPANAQVSVAANYPSTLSGLAFVPLLTVIAAEPANQFVTNGSTATFSVTVTGSAPLDFQWYVGQTPIHGATNSILTITNVSAKNNGAYYMVVSNLFGSVASSVATLATYTPAMITQPPKAEVIKAGQTIALSVAASGSPLEYQWQLDGTNLPGKTAASLTVKNATTNDAGAYTILVSNPSVAVPASASASVSVLPLTPAISSPANNSTTGNSNLTVTGKEPANGGAAAILYQLNGGAPQTAAVSSNGLAWSAAVTLAPGTNIFLVWAANGSGASPSVKSDYILNPFLPFAGAYYGLFSDTSGPAFTNAGYFNLTLGSGRAFSGAVQLDGMKTPFTGQFDTNGAAAFAAGVAPGPVYNVALQLDLSGVNPLTGTVSNTAQAWMASLSAIRASFGAGLPATNYEGSYVLAINGALDPAAAPAGYSFARVSVSATGGVTLNATLADGTTFTSTGTGISQEGDWPLYGSLFSGKGSVLAWLKFPARSAPSQMTSGQAMWFETAGANAHYYPNGFSLLTNQLSSLVNRYTVPPHGVAVLPAVNYTVQLFGGGLGANLTNNLTIATNNAVTVTGLNPAKLGITINAAAGTFGGSFVNPATGRATPLQGVLLPVNNMGFGCFRGANQGGGILIQP